MPLQITTIKNHPVVIDTDNPSVPYFTTETLTLANSAMIASLNLGELNKFPPSSFNDPSPSNDINAGYAIGALWKNTTTQELFICVSNTADNAEWQKLMPALQLAPSLTGNGDSQALGVAISADSNNQLRFGTDSRLFVPTGTYFTGVNVSTTITGLGTTLSPLGVPLSANANNQLRLGTDNRLFVPTGTYFTGVNVSTTITGSGTPLSPLGVPLSANANNQLRLGTDNRLFVPTGTYFTGVRITNPITGDGLNTNVGLRISPDTGNLLSLRSNGLYATGNDRVEFYPEDFGAVPGYLNADSNGLATANNNADAITNCFSAAWNYAVTNGSFQSYIGVQGAEGSITGFPLGGSIGIRHLPTVIIDKHFQIAKPIYIPQQGGTIVVDGYAGAISRWGYDGTGIYTWEYYNTGNFAIEIGRPYTEVSTPFHSYIQGLRLFGFPNAIRHGFPPNNVNLCRIVYKDCYFAAPQASIRVTKNIGIRLFNRSADCTFENCTWDGYATSIDIQSMDKVVLKDCRIQVGERLSSISHISRKSTQGSVVLQHGRLTVDGLIGNPALAKANSTAIQPGGTPYTYVWQPNSGIIQNQYLSFSGLSVYGSGAFWRSRFALTTSGSLSNETGDLTNFISKWEPIREENRNFANIDTQRYCWFYVKEFDSWQPSTEYLEGDCILQSYSGNADPIYWARRTFTTGSTAATFVEDVGNWYPIDSMKNFNAADNFGNPEPLLAGDIRRYPFGNDVNSIGGTAKFWRPKNDISTSTPPSETNSSWVEVTGIPISPGRDATVLYPYLTGAYSSGSQAGEPISAWNDLLIVNQTLLGAEAGGLIPVIWAKQPRIYQTSRPTTNYSQVFYNGLSENNNITLRWENTRKLTTTLLIENSTLQSDRRVQDISQSGISEYGANGERDWLSPVVVLSGLPNRMIIKNNYWNDSACVAALYDPRATVLPKVRYPVSPLTSTSFAFVDVQGNVGGNATNTFGAGHSPAFLTVYTAFNQANTVPHDLAMPLIPQFTVGATALAALSGVPAYSSVVNQGVVSAGSLVTGIDPISNKRELFRLKINRAIPANTTLSTPGERRYWDICEIANLFSTYDVAQITGSDVSLGGQVWLTPGKNVYRSHQVQSITYKNFMGVQEGQIYTVYHTATGAGYENFSNAGFLLSPSGLGLVGTGTPFLSQTGILRAPANSSMSFLPLNFRIREINRSF